jgi:hypothetical protein
MRAISSFCRCATSVPPPQLGEDVVQRLDRPVEGDRFPGELVDPLGHACVAVEDLLLDLVDVCLQPLQHG